MNLDDLAKLAGIQKIDAPVEQPVEAPVAEQPMNGREDMKAMIALIDPEVLNKLGAEAPVEEEGYANSGDHYSGEPEEYKGTLGSPADLSLRRYLGANGMPVNVDETKVYEDHKVEDITEAYAQYKAGQNEEVSVTEGRMKDKMIEDAEEMSKSAFIEKYGEENAGTWESVNESIDESVEEAMVDEDDVEEDNAFNSAAANAKKAGKKSFSFNGKTYPVKMDAKTADGLTDDINDLRRLAGLNELGTMDTTGYKLKPSGGFSVLDIKNDEGIPKYLPYSGKEMGGGFFPNPDYILKPGEKFDLFRDMNDPRFNLPKVSPPPDRKRTPDEYDSLGPAR